MLLITAADKTTEEEAAHSTSVNEKIFNGVDENLNDQGEENDKEPVPSSTGDKGVEPSHPDDDSLNVEGGDKQEKGSIGDFDKLTNNRLSKQANSEDMEESTNREGDEVRDTQNEVSIGDSDKPSNNGLANKAHSDDMEESNDREGDKIDDNAITRNDNNPEAVSPSGEKEHCPHPVVGKLTKVLLKFHAQLEICVR